MVSLKRTAGSLKEIVFGRGHTASTSLLPRELRTGDYDRILIAGSILLAVLGLVMIFSITSVRTSRPTVYLESQSLKLLAGFALFALAHRIDYHTWGRLAPWIYLTGVVCLVLVFVPPFGVEVRHARRWITFGGPAIQASDPARLALIVYLAFQLSKPRDRLERFTTGLLPCLAFLAVMVILVLFQPNLSTALAITVIAGMMFVAGRIPWKHLGVVILPVVLALPILGRGYQSSRVTNWLGYWLRGDALLEGNFQLNQSIIALGSGGFTGRGLGQSHQKEDFLPDAHTDFIFAILGEELGFLGAVLVLSLLGVLLWRAYIAARRAPDRFGSLLAVGIGSSVAVYAAINIAVVTGLFPTTGLPLPLFSYGGTSALITLFSLGILSNIAAQGSRDPLSWSEKG